MAIVKTRPMLYKKSLGIALPFCLLSLGSVIALGLYCWKELSLTTDLIDAQTKHYKHFQQADKLLTQILQETMFSFKPVQKSMQTQDKQTYAHVTITILDQIPDSLRIQLALTKNRDTLITLSCALMRQSNPQEKGSYVFFTDYFTVGTLR